MSEQPGERRRRRVDDAIRVTSIVTAAAFWMSDRNNSISSPATSHRRRSVRSRRHSRIELSVPMGTGAPTTSTRRHPSGVRSRSSIGEPTVFALHAAHGERGQLEIVGMDELEAGDAEGCLQGDAEQPLGRPVGPDNSGICVDQDHGVGEMVEKERDQFAVRIDHGA